MLISCTIIPLSTLFTIETAISPIDRIHLKPLNVPTNLYSAIPLSYFIRLVNVNVHQRIRFHELNIKNCFGYRHFDSPFAGISSVMFQTPFFVKLFHSGVMYSERVYRTRCSECKYSFNSNF